jgi:hypothetical protein
LFYAPIQVLVYVEFREDRCCVFYLCLFSSRRKDIKQKLPNTSKD